MEYKLISSYDFNPFKPDFFKQIIFDNREVESIKDFLNPKEHLLNDWRLLDNIEDGAVLVQKHINNNIFLIVDSDADGYTSSAIFYNYLNSIGNPNIKWMVHTGKQHGIILNKVPDDTDLLVVIDAGSNQYEEHKVLKQRGIDVLVIDHHEAPYYSSDAIMINNQLSENYPNKQLSGAGVAYKFCCAMDEILNVGEDKAQNFLDLAALGIISDSMDIRNLENRYIIHHGLKNINNSFFKELVKKQQYSLGDQLTTIGAMFYISPLINALIRVGEMWEKEMMFEAFIDGQRTIQSTKRGATKETETIATQAARLADNAKSRQKKLTNEIQEEIESSMSNDLVDNPIIVLNIPSVENRNIVGLVANQIAHKYKKPTLLLSAIDGGVLAGSGRNYNLSKIENFKDILNDTNLFEFAEGHQSAFGTAIKEDNVDEFIEYCHENFDLEDSEEIYYVDFELEADEMSSSVAKQIAKFKPLWGKGFEEPYLAIKNIKVLPSDIKYMGSKKNHIKFKYNDIDYIKFFVNIDDFKELNNPVSIDVIGKCSANVWQQKISYQIIIDKYVIKEMDSGFGF